MTSLAAVLQSSQDPPIRIETEAMKVRPDSIFVQREIQYFVIGGKKPSVGTRGLALPAIERARVIIQNRNAAAVEVEETRQEMEWLRDHGRSSTCRRRFGSRSVCADSTKSRHANGSKGWPKRRSALCWLVKRAPNAHVCANPQLSR
jgi:hypothetical protein